jgi:LysM repeat protein
MRYTVRAGDTMSSIAAKKHVTLGALEHANKQVHNPNVIHVGQKLAIPGHKDHFEHPAHPGKAHGHKAHGGHAAGHGQHAAQHGHNAHGGSAHGGKAHHGQAAHHGGKAHGGKAHHAGQAHHGGAKGKNAAAVAHQYLGRYESDLQRHGITKPCPTNVSCANFVSSMLQKAHKINFHTLGVSDLNAKLRARGWHPVSLAHAKPGDVWICNGAHGESHTELVSSNHNGHVTLIGSNNYPSRSNQRINLDGHSAYISGSFILAPPR